MSEKKPRPVITDASAVKVAGTPQYVVSRSYAEVVDLICEGEIEGIASGSYAYEGTEGQTGYKGLRFHHYSATGIAGTSNTPQARRLGFLRSVYWNEIPVVDQDGYYNFQTINLQYAKGKPIGTIPTLDTSDMGSEIGTEVLDLTVQRQVGERLYGPSIEPGEENLPKVSPKRDASLKTGTTIDKYSKTYSILNKECGKIEVRIKVAALSEIIQSPAPQTYKKSGELSYSSKASVGYGDAKARTVEYYIYYQPIFDERFDINRNTASERIQEDKKDNDWILGVKEAVQGKLDSPYIRSSLINLNNENFQDVPGFEGWRIRIVRTTPESLTSFLRNTTFVDSIVEIYGTKLRYPYSAMVYSQFDARSFGRIPARAYDTKLQKIKIPNNYDPLLRTYGKSADAGTHTDNFAGIFNGTSSETLQNDTYSSDWTLNTSSTVYKYGSTAADNSWNGEFKKDANGNFVREWTDNPAWAFYDLITNPRYGLGEYVEENQIDKWALYEIAQYCDVLVPDGYGGVEPRFTINYLITSREEAFKVLNDLAACFRGITFYANGMIHAVQDQLKDPVYQFTNSNVSDGNFTYSSSAKRARHTVAIVRYNDKRNLFQPAIEYVEDEEAVRRYGIREIETSALGCTSRAQARRFGEWILASESQETETVTFAAGHEGAYLKPGDIIQIYDNFRSPLKRSGRTNAVRRLIPDHESPTTHFDPSFDSLVLDCAINFTADKKYKLSLLTPTFNYDPSGIIEGDFDSSLDDNIRRSAVQTLVFNGSDTKTITGEQFRSDYHEGPDAVCTEIYFSTGAPGTSWDRDYGEGNKFDFDNYVITGYTNTGVNTDGNSDTVQNYSGGCFSGQNLIWSIEPDDSSDTEFISGHFSDYRVINIAEEESSVYNVSALAYSTGKYADVDSSVALDSVNTFKSPIFNTGDSTTQRSNSYVTRNNYQGTFTVSQGEANNPKYKTAVISFQPAGYERRTDISNTSAGESVIPDDNIMYYVCSSTTNPEAGAIGNSFIYAVDFTTTYKQDIVYTISSLNENFVERDADGNPQKITAEILLNSNDDRYISVFAVSPEGVISQGMLLKAEGFEGVTTASAIENITISQLVTNGSDGTAANKILVPTEDSQPGFEWELSNKEALYNDDTKKYLLNVPEDGFNYRLTVREPSEGNIPSNEIYLEITGYNIPETTASFVLQTVYNNPNTLENLYSDTDAKGFMKGGYIPGGGGSDGSLPHAQIKTADYIAVPKSGFIIKNNPNLFPVRKFDFIVEAHDVEGNTSPGGKIWNNTLLNADSSTKQLSNYPAEGLNDTYDIIGVDIVSPSGMFFVPEKFTDENDFPQEFVSQDTAFKKGYPYLATAQALANGRLHIDIEQPADKHGNVIYPHKAFNNIFDDAVGVVYYLSTGDHSVRFVQQGDTAGKGSIQAYNPAPEFRIAREKIKPLGGIDANANNLGFAGTDDPSSDLDNDKFGGIVDHTTQNKNGAPEYISFYRDYHLLGDAESPYSFSFPCNQIKDKDISNISIVFGFFDNLSLLRAFEEDGVTPKYMKKADGTLSATPQIFSDANINFSFPLGLGAKYANTVSPSDYIAQGQDFAKRIREKVDNNGKELADFAQAEGSSIRLSEKIFLSKAVDAQTFRAWGEVFIPGLKQGKYWDYEDIKEDGIVRRVYTLNEKGKEQHIITKGIPPSYYDVKLHHAVNSAIWNVKGWCKITISNLNIDPDKTSIMLHAEGYDNRYNKLRSSKKKGFKLSRNPGDVTWAGDMSAGSGDKVGDTTHTTYPASAAIVEKSSNSLVIDVRNTHSNKRYTDSGESAPSYYMKPIRVKIGILISDEW